MATVRDTDLPDLLISLGYQVKRIGRYYTTQEMDSIRIKDRRTWFRYSEGIGGDAITFLQRFYNKSFPEAVEYLLTWHGRARDSPPVSTPRQTKEKEEKVPFIGLSTKVYEGTDSSTLAKGAGHFPGTSIWDGNCCIAGHNRGVRDDFGDLHTLEPGDTITWTTKLGTRTYQVVSVEKVLETDTSGTATTSDNRITLFTCVRDQRAYRWCVQAVEC